MRHIPHPVVKPTTLRCTDGKDNLKACVSHLGATVKNTIAMQKSCTPFNNVCPLKTRRSNAVPPPKLDWHNRNYNLHLFTFIVYASIILMLDHLELTVKSAIGVAG